MVKQWFVGGYAIHLFLNPVVSGDWAKFIQKEKNNMNKLVCFILVMNFNKGKKKSFVQVADRMPSAS